MRGFTSAIFVLFALTLFAPVARGNAPVLLRAQGGAWQPGMDRLYGFPDVAASAAIPLRMASELTFEHAPHEGSVFQCSRGSLSGAEIDHTECQSGLSVPSQGAAMSGYLQQVAVFKGDGIFFPDSEEYHRRNFFTKCPDSPSTVQGVLDQDLSAPFHAVCESTVDLQCEGLPMNQTFHVIKSDTTPARFQVRTAAHVINLVNRRLLGARDLDLSSEQGVYDFSKCFLVAGRPGRTLAGVKLGDLKVRNERVLSAIKSRLDLNFISDEDLRKNDIAWFDLEVQAGSDSEKILNKIALPTLPERRYGDLANATICTAGRYGPGGEHVARCLDSTPSEPRGAQVDSDGFIRTRTPAVMGMSGGPIAVFLNGVTYGVAAISSGVDGGETSSARGGAAGGRVFIVDRDNPDPALLNHGITYGADPFR